MIFKLDGGLDSRPGSTLSVKNSLVPRPSNYKEFVQLSLNASTVSKSITAINPLEGTPFFIHVLCLHACEKGVPSK